MLALTVQQPWAWAIAAGHKTIENRIWAAQHRGPLAIHAGKAWDEEGTPYARRVIEELGVIEPDTEVGDRHLLAQGAIVAMVRLAGVCWVSRRTPTVVCDCGPWAMPGQFHWQLTNIRALTEPIPMRGRQGLWMADLEHQEADHGR